MRVSPLERDPKGPMRAFLTLPLQIKRAAYGPLPVAVQWDIP